MEDRYSEKMRRLGNDCASWLAKAEQERSEHDGRHTKQECQFLQQAAAVCSEMSRISVGEEKEYYARRVKELNGRIARIVHEIDPDYFKRKSENLRNEKTGETPPASPDSGDDGISEETVRSWYKPIPDHGFDEITGMSPVKEKLSTSLRESQLLKLSAFLGISKQKSYIFVGPPGCGKTYITEAFVHELAEALKKDGREFYYLKLDSSEILAKYVGDGERTVRRMFEEAEAHTPCVIFIDEIDALCKNRSKSDLPEYASTLTTAFLTGYNRIKKCREPIIFIGATNFPGDIDRAMLDRVEVVNVPFPDADAKASRFEQELGKNLIPEEGFSYAEMAALTETPAYNYRDIERLCDEIRIRLLTVSMERYGDEDAAIEAIRSGELTVTRELFTGCQQTCRPVDKTAILDALRDWDDAQWE